MGQAQHQLLQIVVLMQHLHQAQNALLHDAVVFQLQSDDSCVGLRMPQRKGEVVSSSPTMVQNSSSHLNNPVMGRCYGSGVAVAQMFICWRRSTQSGHLKSQWDH